MQVSLEGDRDVDKCLGDTIGVNYEVYILHLVIFFPDQTSDYTHPIALKGHLALLMLLDHVWLNAAIRLQCHSLHDRLLHVLLLLTFILHR